MEKENMDLNYKSREGLTIVMGEKEHGKSSIVNIMMREVEGKAEKTQRTTAIQIAEAKFGNSQHPVMDTPGISLQISELRMASIKQGIQRELANRLNKQEITHIRCLFIVQQFNSEANLQFIKKYLVEIFGASILNYVTVLITNYEELILEYPDEIDYIKERHLNIVKKVFSPMTRIGYVSLYPSRQILQDIKIVGEEIYKEVINPKAHIFQFITGNKGGFDLKEICEKFEGRSNQIEYFYNQLMENPHDYIDAKEENTDICVIMNFVLIYSINDSKLREIQIDIEDLKGKLIFSFLKGKLKIHEDPPIELDSIFKLDQKPSDKLYGILMKYIMKNVDIQFKLIKEDIQMSIEIIQDQRRKLLNEIIIGEDLEAPPEIQILPGNEYKLVCIWPNRVKCGNINHQYFAPPFHFQFIAPPFNKEIIDQKWNEYENSMYL